MPTALRELALTADLVARTTRLVEDAGPSPSAVYMTDEDYDVAIGNVLADAPAGEIWLFGYGSLLWKPVCEFSERRIAIVRGWHRAVFRFRYHSQSLDRAGRALHAMGKIAKQIDPNAGMDFPDKPHGMHWSR